MKRTICRVAVALIALLLLSAASFAEDKSLGDVLKQTPLKFTALENQPDSFRVPFDAKEGKTIDVFVTYNDEKKQFALIFATVVDKEDNFAYGRDVLLEAMKLNNDYPGIKFVLDQKHGDLDCQTEVYMATITAESLAMYVNLVASMADDNAAKLNQLAGGEAEEGAAPAQPAEPQAAADGIRWYNTLTEAKAAATAQGKPIMVDFFATWCGPCKQLDQQTYKDAQVISAASKFIAAKVDVDKHQDTAQAYNIEAMPTIVILDAQGRELRRKVGFMDAKEMLALMQGTN